LRRISWAILGVLLAAAPLAAFDDKGESPEAMKLKGRSTAPVAADIDAAVTLDALLAKSAETAWSTSKAGVVEGRVVQVEREHDGDTHVVLAPAGGETDTKKWVIVEVTPTWQKRAPALAEAKLQGLKGKTVRATGWLFYEPDGEDMDPRGTRWELHPVTSIEVVP
jgi:hypothetical protein